MKIFISYRRDDSAGHAGRLSDHLTAHFGAQHIFMDIDAIQPGEDFRKAIENAVGSCDVVLVMMGKQWLNVADTQGQRRLDDPRDWVRVEIASSLANPRVRVIPILVRGAVMPGVHELPDDLKELAWRNAIELSDNRFQYDANKLIGVIESLEIQPAKTTANAKPKIGAAKLGGAFVGIAIIGLLVWLAASGILGGSKASANTPTGVSEATSVVIEALATTAPTKESAPPTSANTAIQPILVTTPQPGEILVLVSKLEAVNTTERDVARFIKEDLSQRLNLSFSNYVVGEYPEVISNKDQAIEVAEANQAVIIVWGNYTTDFVELNIQVGDLSRFEHIVINRNAIEEATNLRVRIKDERQESIVQGIISTLIVLQTADSNSYEAMRNLAILETMQVSLPDTITPSVSGFVAKYCVNYVSNEAEALNNINQALALNGGNPLLYVFRGTIRQKLGDLNNAQQDIATAMQLSSDNWGLALILQANNLFFAGNPAGAIAAMDKVITANTHDWWSYNVRGSYYLLLGDLSSARADFASAIAIGPTANFPYVYSSLISMHEGRLDDAKKFLVQALQITPDPTYGEKIVYAFTGGKVSYPNLDALSSYGRLTLGQNSEALTIADRGIQVFPLADLYFIKGTAECNQHQYKEAEASFTKGLSLDSEYALLYLLRADVRTKQGNLKGAQSDLAALQSTKQFSLFAPYLQNSQAGSFTCETLFTSSP